MRTIAISLFVFLLGMQITQACTISLQVVETGQTTATKTYSLADSQCDRVVAAYQVAANASVNGTATRAQVLNYWANQLIQVTTVLYVQQMERAAAEAAADVGVTVISPQ